VALPEISDALVSIASGTSVTASLRAAVAALPALTFAAGAAAQEWPSYGGDPGGQRFSGATQITPQNVGRLAPAWIFHTGEHRPAGPKGSSFKDTPILADGKLLVCTSTDRVFALDPLTGRALWAFDPKLTARLKPASDFLCRGVAVWRDTAASRVPIASPAWCWQRST
jgi:quinoprotein glucose dehydrogenase